LIGGVIDQFYICLFKAPSFYIYAMKTTLACLLLFVTSNLVHAQEITMYKTFGGVRFERDTVIISLRQVSEILSIEPQAAAEFKLARTNYSAAGVLGFAGGFLLAFPIGTAIAGGNPEWGLAAGGAVLILASLPFNKAFKARAGSALDKYNSRLPKARLIKPQFYFTGTGGTIRIRF
jgi:hypothetical protein